MQDVWKDRWTILKSQLQELAISFGDLLMPAVRSIVAGLQGMVNVLNAMPDGVKRVIMIIALLVAALGPVLILIGKTISAVGTIMTWIPKLAGAINTVKVRCFECHDDGEPHRHCNCCHCRSCGGVYLSLEY